MEAVQKGLWYFVVLIFLPFEVALHQDKDSIVRLEEGMVLDCLCPWTGNFTMVSWARMPERDTVGVFHPEYGPAFPYQYQGRIEFLRTTEMDGSITMKNVTHQDIGVYLCSLQTFPLGLWIKLVHVEDLDEPPEEVNSTQPPSPEVTVTDTELVAEQSNNLTIRCNHHHNGTIYQVILERMLDDRHWLIIGVCKKVEGGLVGEDYSDRGRVNCADSLDVSLHLTNVVEKDSGFYRCTFNTDVGVQTTTVQLTVTDPGPGGFSLSLYMMYIYIGAGAAGLFLVIAIIILALRRRKKNKREEYRVRLHPSQRQPRIYENICTYHPRNPKASRQMRNCPIYANLQTVHSAAGARRPP